MIHWRSAPVRPTAPHAWPARTPRHKAVRPGARRPFNEPGRHPLSVQHLDQGAGAFDRCVPKRGQHHRGGVERRPVTDPLTTPPSGAHAVVVVLHGHRRCGSRYSVRHRITFTSQVSTSRSRHRRHQPDHPRSRGTASVGLPACDAADPDPASGHARDGPAAHPVTGRPSAAARTTLVLLPTGLAVSLAPGLGRDRLLRGRRPGIVTARAQPTLQLRDPQRQRPHRRPQFDVLNVPHMPQRLDLGIPGSQQLPQQRVCAAKLLNQLRGGRVGHNPGSSPSTPDRSSTPARRVTRRRRRGSQPRRPDPPVMDTREVQR